MSTCISRVWLIIPLLVSTGAAMAQAYPSLGAIRLVVPFSPGGGADFVGRTIARELGKSWSHTIIVDNRPGGGTNIGASLVAKAAPDGHTLFLSTTANVVNKFVQKAPSYDVVKDFEPISLTTTVPIILVVHPSLPARSVKELISLMRQRPAQLTFGSPGFASANHLSGELLKSMAHVDMIHVAYKGGPPAVVDLLSGQITMYFAAAPSVLPHVQVGKLRAIAVTSGKRSPAAPQVPTIAESGVPGYETLSWHGLMAPAGTPKSTVEKLSAEVGRVLALPDVAEVLRSQGVETIATSPIQFAKFIKEELAKYEALSNKGKLVPE